MKQIKTNRIVQIIYPLLVYYVLYNLSYTVFEYLFGQSMGKLFNLLLAGLVTLVPEYMLYKGSPKLVADDKLTVKELLFDFFYVLLIVGLGILLNVIISQTGLMKASNGFSSANKILKDGNIIIKILCNACIIPILEELLYRGIICGQLVIMKNVVFATVFSSFCFGILHFNIVQFLYAFIVGLALGAVYCKTKRLWVVMLAHGLTNLIVILFT